MEKKKKERKEKHIQKTNNFSVKLMFSKNGSYKYKAESY